MNNMDKKVTFFVRYDNVFEKVEQEFAEVSSSNSQNDVRPENYYG